MQLRKSLSCSSSDSILALLLVLTRILAFRTLSKGPRGSETQVVLQWPPRLPQEATAATERRKEAKTWDNGALSPGTDQNPGKWTMEPWERDHRTLETDQGTLGDGSWNPRSQTMKFQELRQKSQS